MRLRNKILIPFLIVVLANAIGLSIACQFLLKPVFIHDSRVHMENYIDKIERVLKVDPNNEDGELVALLSDINDEYSIQTKIVDADLNILFTQNGARTYVEKPLKKRTNRVIQEYKESGTDPFTVMRYDDEDKIKRLYYVHQTENQYYIVLEKAIRGIDQNIRIMTKFVLITIILLAVCCCILWFIFASGFAKRMVAMSRVTKKMSQLDFSEKVNYRSNDEIGTLAESIDHLSDKLRENIEQMQRELERRKALIRNISHEIRTPVTTIRGYAENTQIVGQENKKIMHYSDIIIEECDALDDMVKEILELSGVEDGNEIYQMEQISTGDLFSSVRNRIGREMPDECILMETEDKIINGVPILLERAVLNFLRNAVKYRIPETEILLRGYHLNSCYYFEVVNQGEEIPESEQEYIWDVFYRIDKSRKRCGNYGIGLSIVKVIAELHGGDYGVSCENGSTRFWFCVPMK